MKNIALVVIILLVLVCAAVYVIKEKKKGVKCVGCPYAKECAERSNKCSCNK